MKLKTFCRCSLFPSWSGYQHPATSCYVVLIRLSQGEEAKYLVYNTTENYDYEHETGVKS